jgi:hypothetical protein
LLTRKVGLRLRIQELRLDLPAIDAAGCIGLVDREDDGALRLIAEIAIVPGSAVGTPILIGSVASAGWAAVKPSIAAAALTSSLDLRVNLIAILLLVRARLLGRRDTA